MIKRLISSVIAVCVTLTAYCSAYALNLSGANYPDVYILDRIMNWTSTMPIYDESELYLPSRETMEALGSTVEWDNGSVTISFHNIELKLDIQSQKLYCISPYETTEIEDSVIQRGNFTYIRMSALQGIVDIVETDVEHGNKVSLRDYVPSEITYKNKTWSKGSSQSVSLDGKKTTVVGMTVNGLEIHKLQKYILWIIPWGYEIYVQDTDNKQFVKFIK